MGPYLGTGSLQRQSIKGRSLRWTLIQYDQYPYKKGKFGHMHSCRLPQEEEGGDEDNVSTCLGMKDGLQATRK